MAIYLSSQGSAQTEHLVHIFNSVYDHVLCYCCKGHNLWGRRNSLGLDILSEGNANMVQLEWAVEMCWKFEISGVK